MIDGYVDISYLEIKRYLAEVSKKEGVCDALPAGRFSITKAGIRYYHLVCKDMGGKSTGCGAEYCENCLRRKK